MSSVWIPQLTRGLLAVVLGVVITLTLEHTPAFGLVTFGAFALLAGAVLLAGVLRGGYAGPMRTPFLAQALFTVVAGIVAIAVSGGSVVLLGLVVGVWAIVTGALEGVSGVLARGRSPLGRDWILTGVLTVALGIVALVLPSDFTQAFAGEKGVSGTLTSSVILIGVLGAWAILVGVLQTISGISLRGSARPATT